MSAFEILAEFQKKYYTTVVLLALFFTAALASFGQHIDFESDISKEFPQGEDVFRFTNYAKESFAGYDSIIVNIRIDDEVADNPIQDVREADVMLAAYRLDGILREEYSVVDVQSLAAVFKTAGIPPLSDGVVELVIDEASEYEEIFVSDDKSAMMMIVKPETLRSKEDIANFVAMLEDDIKRADFPYGVKAELTGKPIMRIDILDLLRSDFFYTIAVAFVGILIFISLIMGRVSDTALILMPLVLGLVWYAGVLVLFGMMLSVATVATGALILGLGVEYSIFIYTKFRHALDNSRFADFDDRVDEAIEAAVSTTGRAIFGSAMTTIAAFLALNASGIPLIGNLGTMSAIGIACVLVASVVVNPCIFAVVERVRHMYFSGKNQGAGVLR